MKDTHRHLLRCGILLISTIGLLACVVMISSVQLPLINYTLRSQTPHHVQHYSRRRLSYSTSTVSAEDPYEPRTFDLSRGKGLFNSWIQRIKDYGDSVMLNFSANNQKATDRLFTKLKLDQIGLESKFLESTIFQTWFNSVSKAYRKNSEAGDVAMVVTLISHYGNDAVANMLFASRNSDEMWKRLEKALFTTWRSTTSNTDDVFKLLKLNEGDNLLTRPLWKMWIWYVQDVSGVSGDHLHKLLVQGLRNHYADDYLAQMLVTAQQNWKTKSIAKNLERGMRHVWLELEYSADDVFMRLKLDNLGDNVFGSPVYKTWTTYVSWLKGSTDEAIFNVLKNHYGETGLTKLVASVKAGQRYWGLVKNVEREILRHQGKTSDEIFPLLKLGEKDEKMFESLQFATWIDAVSDKSVALSQLRGQFKEVDLARVIARSLKDRNGANWSRIKAIQEQQFRSWIDKSSKWEDIFLKSHHDTIDASIVNAFLDYQRKIKSA